VEGKEKKGAGNEKRDGRLSGGKKTGGWTKKALDKEIQKASWSKTRKMLCGSFPPKKKEGKRGGHLERKHFEGKREQTNSLIPERRPRKPRKRQYSKNKF